MIVGNCPNGVYSMMEKGKGGGEYGAVLDLVAGLGV